MFGRFRIEKWKENRGEGRGMGEKGDGRWAETG